MFVRKNIVKISWQKLVVIAALGLILGYTAPTQISAKEPLQVTRGNFVMFAAGLEKDFAISGQAMMVRSAAGHTTVTVRVKGLRPNTRYDVHVHNQACNNETSGGHYQHEIGGAVDNTNEIWPLLTTNAAGNGFSKSVNDFVARSDARSVVIHDADSSRLACADLRRNAVSPYSLGTQPVEELASSRTVAANPELMVASRYRPVEAKVVQSDSAYYAANPELMVAQRYAAKTNLRYSEAFLEKVETR